MRFKTIPQKVEYQISDHMIPFLIGEYHKSEDEQKVKIDVKCFRVSISMVPFFFLTTINIGLPKLPDISENLSGKSCAN